MANCTCPDHHVAACAGPAAYDAVRDGQEYRFCTKCLGASDEIVRVLPVEDWDAQAKYNPIGARLLMRRLERQMRGHG